MPSEIYEYSWVHEDADELNSEAEYGWRVVPGIRDNDNDDITYLLMERQVSPEGADGGSDEGVDEPVDPADGIEDDGTK